MRRQAMLIGLVATLAAGAVAVPNASAATTRTLSGTVACQNGKVAVGLWVESSAGGSKWSDTLTRRAGSAWIADYTATITTSTASTNVQLHVGCGGDSVTWWSNNQTVSRTVTGNSSVSALCKEAPGTGQRCRWWGNTVLVGMPFAGDWDRFGTTPPSSHGNDTASVKDWAVDIYQASGTKTYLRLYAPRGKTLTVRASSGNAGCTGVCSVGQNAKVDVLLNGTLLGWVNFGHLKSVPTTIGSATAQLGTLNLWPYDASFWQVSSASGVHTHFTMDNASGYSCYWPLAAKTTYPLGRMIGKLGATDAPGINSVCPY